MRKLIVFAALSLVLSANAFAGPEHAHEAKPGSAEFEKMKGLVGAWKGTMNSPEEGQKDAMAEYKLTSGGSVVVETLFPGTPHEMVSVYHDDETGKLTMTHYCAFGNQPKLQLVGTDGGTIKLDLAPNSEIAPTDPHMHALNLELKDNELTQSWTQYREGKPAGSTVISLKKV